MAETAEEAASGALVALGRGAGVLAARVGATDGVVASSTASDVPYSAILHHLLSCCLALELFVEGEDCTLRGIVDVASSATSCAELGRCLRKLMAEDIGRSASCGAGGGLWCLEGVASSSTSAVDVLGGRWVWLSDFVVGWHIC